MVNLLSRRVAGVLDVRLHTVEAMLSDLRVAHELGCQGMVAISPNSGVCIPPNVICSIWRYVDVSV